MYFSILLILAAVFAVIALVQKSLTYGIISLLLVIAALVLPLSHTFHSQYKPNQTPIIYAER